MGVAGAVGALLALVVAVIVGASTSATVTSCVAASTQRFDVVAGEVVVRSIGSDLRMDYTVVGQATNIAARMEQMATPGSVLLTPDSLRLAEGYVQVKPLGPVSVVTSSGDAASSSSPARPASIEHSTWAAMTGTEVRTPERRATSGLPPTA